MSRPTAPRQQSRALRFALADAHRHRSLMDRLENIRVRDAFLNLTAAFPRGRASVPFRSTFDNAARNECPTDPKGLELRDFLRALMIAAVETGDVDAVEGTKIEITRFMAEIQSQVFAVAPQGTTPSLSDATVRASKETAEAMAAIAEAGTTRCPTAIERAAKESDEAVVAIGAFRASAMAAILAKRSTVGHAS